jgi:ABC-type multidrug transport system fused ATPase/permease subunit
MFLVSCTGFLNDVQSINMKRKLNEQFTQHIVEKYRRIEFACFEDTKIQDTLLRMGNSPQDLILNTFQDFMSALSTFISIVGVIFIFAQISWFLPLIFFLIIPLMIWLDFLAMNTMNDMFNSQTEDERWLSYYAGLLSTKNSLLELRVFSAANYIMNLWKVKNKKVLRERLKTTIRAQKYFAVNSAVIFTWIGILLFSMIWGISRSLVSLGLFVSLVGSAGSILEITERLSFILSNITRHYLQVQHYAVFINLPENPKRDAEAAFPNGIHEIEFDNVYFRYPNTENEILKGVSFKTSNAERLSIVGKNGAGKSTVIKLLCRLYQPDAGTIKINGVNLNDLSERQLSDTLCVVFQDYCCYNLSLRENIALSNIEKITGDFEIQQALIKGKAHMISDNLDVPLGKIEDEGIDVSGGQWQRIAISRALFSDSPFVILDEPTASLDPLAESEMYQSFTDILQDRGCIMISHRLASAKMADKVIVIDDGIVAENGRHAALLKEHGLYAKMWEAQSHWYVGGMDGVGNEK